MFNLLFYCHIILYWEKVTFYEKFSHNLNLNITHISSFQCYKWKYQHSEKYLNFKKIRLKWKIVKHFTRPKQRAEIIQSPKFRNCIVKWVIFFVILCWHWDDLQLSLMMSIGTCGPILNHLCFGPDFIFGDCFRVF